MLYKYPARGGHLFHAA